jgi:hypothetical protein
MRFHHVNLAVHPDLLEDEMAFLSEGLGLVRVEAGPELADRARWFAFPDGMQVHLSRTTDPINTKPGHIAVNVGADLDAIEGRLDTSGLHPVRRDGAEMSVTIVSDPAGHVWELRTAD